MTNINDDERIARIIYYPQMIEGATLKENAFPTDELIKKKNKNGCSVDRCDLMDDHDRLLREKAIKYANPGADRSPYGYCIATARRIRELKIQNTKDSAQALDVFPDPINKEGEQNPWDHAHALLHKKNENYTRSHIRGMRDHLVALFSEEIVQF